MMSFWPSLNRSVISGVAYTLLCASDIHRSSRFWGHAPLSSTSWLLPTPAQIRSPPGCGSIQCLDELEVQGPDASGCPGFNRCQTRRQGPRPERPAACLVLPAAAAWSATHATRPLKRHVAEEEGGTGRDTATTHSGLWESSCAVRFRRPCAAAVSARAAAVASSLTCLPATVLVS